MRLREKVKADIGRTVQEADNVESAFISSTDGSRDAVTVQLLRTGENIQRLVKNIFTGIDFVASPEHHFSILLTQGRQLSSANSVLIDRKWVRPNVFVRPNLGYAR